MRTRLFIGQFLVASLMFTIGCITNGKSGTNGHTSEMLHKVHVESVNVFTEGNSVEVQVTGKLPSSAYSFELFETTVEDRRIEIIPLAEHDPDKIVTQHLVPFDQTTRIEGLEPGTYEIRVVGDDDFVINRVISIPA